MTDDRVVWDRLVARCCEESGWYAHTVESVLRSALKFILLFGGETMTEGDDVMWDRLVAHCAKETEMLPPALQKMLRAALLYLTSLPKEG